MWQWRRSCADPSFVTQFSYSQRLGSYLYVIAIWFWVCVFIPGLRSTMCHRIPLWFTDSGHTCCCPTFFLHFSSFSHSFPSLSTSTEDKKKNTDWFVICTCAVSVETAYMWRSVCVCVFIQRVERGRRRSWVLYFKKGCGETCLSAWSWERRSLWVWNSRQRRHIHTDTGSVVAKGDADSWRASPPA